MNRMYRSIWNAALGSWVAAPETARSGCGKSSGALVQGPVTRGSRESLDRTRLGPLALAIAVLTGGSALALSLVPGAAWAQNYGAMGGAGQTAGYEGGAAGAAGGGAASGAAGTGLSPNGGHGHGLGGGGGGGGGGGYSYTAGGDVSTVLRGGNGGNGSGYGGGGGGGDGVRITPTAPSASINAAVTGGRGGQGAAAGGGGAGVVFLGNGFLTTNQQVSGGNGGAAGSNGGGGGGGVGVIMQGASQLTANAKIVGGDGSIGASVYSSGNGGAGVLLVGKGGVTTTAMGSITGGSATGVGRGGEGVLLLTGGTVFNAGTIRGGNGGGAKSGGVGGLAGGMGSGGALGFIPYTSSESAPGGAGIRGAGITITNSGTIAGGTSPGVQADAIAFTGGSNRLTLKTGSNLTGAINIFSGATAGIVAGDDGLVMNNAIVLGGSGTVDSNGNAFEVSGVVSGAGSLTKSGAGMLSLSGANTYTGGTLIADGTLRVGNGGTTGSLSGDVVNNATLAFGRSDAVDFGGAISGTGAVVQDGTGTLTLTNVNRYHGGTTIRQGTLAGNAASFGSGGIDISPSGLLAIRQDTDADFANTLSGSGAFTKGGSAVLNLTGDSSAFRGKTDMQSGTLAVNGKLGGSLAVHDGATLTGNGTVGSTAVLAGGTVAPGTVGSLHVAGDLRFASGSVYQVQADPHSNASSRIVVTGTATLGGSVVHVGPEGGFEFAKTYTILQAGSLSGQFDTVASQYAYLDPKLQYVSNEVQLQLQRKSSGGGILSFSDLASTPNQGAVAANIEGQGLGALYDHVLHLPAGSPGGVLDQLSGDSHANVLGSLPAQAAIAPRVSMQHLRRNMRAGLRPGAAMAQSGGPLPAAAWPSAKALPLWAEVVGRWQTQDGDGNAARTRQHTGGLFIGGDEEVGDGWRLGGSLGYTRADGKVADRTAVFTTDSYSATVYGGKSFAQGAGHLNVQGGLAYTWHEIATERQVSSLEQTLKADYRARTAQLFAEVGYALGQYGKVGVEPFAGINVGQQRTGAFQEQGGFAALTGQSSSENQSSSTLGLRAHSDFKLGRSEGRLRASLGWRHAFGDLQQQKTMAFAGAQNFTVAGAALARNTAVLGLDAELELSRRASLVLEYRGEYGSGSRDHAAGVALRWAF